MDSNQIVSACQVVLGENETSCMGKVCKTCMQMEGYQRSVWTFGILIVIGLIIVIALLTKLLKSHRTVKKKK